MSVTPKKHRDKLKKYIKIWNRATGSLWKDFDIEVIQDNNLK